MSISQNFPTIDPTLRLNFQGARRLDPRITFTRASTATYVDEDGLIKTAGVDEARFDYDPETGESLGLLIEESRTNIVLDNSNPSSWRSVGFANNETTYQIKGMPTVRLQDITTDGDSPNLLGGNYTTGQVTLSCYIDAINSTASFITLFLFGGGYINTTWHLGSGVPVHNGSYNINNTNHSNGTQQVIDCGGGIYRLILSCTYSGPTTASRFYVSHGNQNTAYVIIAGMQMEQGSFPTSYIPTSGSAVTRLADYASITGTNFTDFYNPIEGTFYSSFIRNLQTNGFLVGLGYGGSNYIGMGYSASPSLADIYIQPLVGSLDDLKSVGGNVRSKSIVSYDSSGASGCINGGPVVSEAASGGLPSGTNGKLYIGTSAYDPPTIGTGLISSIVYYPERLTDAQLQSLTK